MNLRDMIYEIDYKIDESIRFGKVEGYSTLGDVGAKGYIQYVATTELRDGEDDPFEGFGWTPKEAIQNLLKILKEHFAPTQGES